MNIRDELCAFNRDFVAGVDRGGNIWAYWHGVNESTGSREWKWHEPSRFYQYRNLSQKSYLPRTISELITAKSNKSGIWNSSMIQIAWGVKGSRYSVQDVVELPVEDTTLFYNYRCEDTDAGVRLEKWPRFRSILSEELGSPVTKCSDVRTVCNHDIGEGVRARQYCPVTCGCDNPSSHLPTIAPSKGCPSTCFQGDKFLNLLGKLSCADWTPIRRRELDGKDLLSEYYEGMLGIYAFDERYDGEMNSVVQAMNNTLFSSGCSGLVHFLGSA